MRKFLSLLMTLVFAFGLFTATSAQAAEKTVYCKMTQSWWTDGGASVGAYAWTEGQPSNADWPGVKMTAVEGQVGLWKIDLDLSKYEKVIFTRLKGDGSEDWGAKTKDQTIPTDDKDLFTITTESAVWGDPGCDGTWSKYVPETPAKFYITGDSALIVDAGLDKAKAWKADAIKSEKDTFELDLKANQDYVLKVTVNGTWQGANNVKGYNELSEKTPGLQDISNDHNIGFRLDKAGKVKVVYKAGEPEVFKVLGDFHVEIPAKFYITGDSALIVDAGLDKAKAWNPGAIKSEKDTFELDLKANQDYVLKVTVNGTWEGANNVKGYNELSEKTPGLQDLSDDHNIGFRLDKAGKVKVVYKAGEPEVFKVLGDFHVEIPAKFYITGDTALVVAGGADKMKAWKADAIKSEKDTFVLNLPVGEYHLKVTDGTWEDAKGFSKLTAPVAEGLSADADDNIFFKLAEAGEVKVIYTDKVFKLEGNFYVPKPHYFIAGTMTDWASKMVELKADKADSLSIAIALEADSLYEFKVVKVLGTDTTWFGNEQEATMEYGNSTGWWLKGDKNVGLQTTKAGEYLFIFRANENNEISVVIPAPDKKYYAKYAPEWAWTLLTEKEGKWLTDTIVYKGIGVNINDKAADEGNMFFSNTVEEEGVRPIAGAEIAENDTVLFSFNPADSVLTAVLVGKYVAPVAHYFIAGTMTDWASKMVELKADKADSLSIAIALEADSLYEFKVVKVLGADTTWFGNEQEATMEYGNSTGWWLKGDKNVGLQTTKAGEYLFIFRANENNEISVVIPAPDPVEKPKFYVTGNAALVGEELQWNPAAIKSMTDTLVLDLKVDQNYMLKLTLDGEWNEHVLGFDALTEKAEGLTRGEGSDNDNICFSMAEDGKVNVIYFVENEKVTFKLEGKFYVAPVELPKVAIAGAMNDWNENANVMKAAEDGLTASVKINLAADNYDFKVVVDGHWLGRDATYDITRENPKAEGVDKEISYGPNLVLHADAEGEYTFTWTYATNTIVVTFPDAPIVEQPKFYVTGNAALVGEELQWNPAAIKSMTDTLELNLAAGIDYELKVTLNGTWVGENNVKGFNELTEKTEGLKDIGNDHNIGFRLAEAGVVKVIYTAEVFKLIGNFYVEPVEQPKFYVTGNAALVGEELQWNPAAVKSMTDTLTLNLEANVDYELKVTLNGTWVGENNVKGYNELTEMTKGLNDIGNDHNIGFKLNNAGEVKVIYIAAVDGQAEVFKLIGDFHVEPGAGFDNIDASQKAVKLIYNGQVVILRGDKVYTVTGQLIQ